MRWGCKESSPSHWHRAFAILPTRMWDGTWVWLEHYEYRLKVNLSGMDYLVRRVLGSEDIGPFAVSAPTSPPPCKPKS